MDWKGLLRHVAPVLGGILSIAAPGSAPFVAALSAASQATLGHADGSPEEIAAAVAGKPELAAELRKADQDFALKLGAQQVDLAKAAQDTARVEAQSADDYVRRTRPKLARQSAAVTLAYGLVTGLVFPILNSAFGYQLPGPESWIILALFTPCAAYMGVRTGDKIAEAWAIRGAR